MRNKATTYTAEMIQSRREWLAELTHTQLKHLAHFFGRPRKILRGKKLNAPSVSLMCLWGLLVPSRINGEHARGVFFHPYGNHRREHSLPLIPSVRTLSARSGGVNVKILKDALKSDPTFVFKSSAQAQSFVTWIEANFGRIKEIAEKTSGHLRLIKARSDD